MKFILTLLIVGLTQVNALSQNAYSTIKVSNDIELIKISNNAYVHVSYTILPQYGRISANGLIFINGSEAFLFDTPWTDALTKDLVSFLKDSLNIKIIGFAPNHWHDDCMGGLGYLQNQKIESYANQKTIELAKLHDLPVPAHGFKDSLELRLSDKLIKCYYLGAAHSLDNIVVWIPSEQILFAGCMVKGLGSNNLGNTADGDLNAYPKTIERLINKFPYARIVIPGHGQFGGLDLIEHTKELVRK